MFVPHPFMLHQGTFSGSKARRYGARLDVRHLHRLAAIFLLSAATGFAATRYVDVNSPGPFPPFLSWDTAATNIQDAIDIAVSGDQLLVADGIYRARNDATSSVVSVNTTLFLSSVNGAQTTIIDGGNQLRCAQLKGSTRITGFTFTNGFAAGNGGGVLCDSSLVVISNCVVGANVASAAGNGGGVYLGTLRNCVLVSNTAYGNGGGANSSTLINCAVGNNSAAEGGGLYYCTASNCTIVGNSAIWGAGVYQSTLNYCTISSNTASTDGGGAYWGTAANCLIEGNSAGGSGGGLYQTMAQACAITRNTANQGGGVYSAGVSNCTIIANAAIKGGGVKDGTYRNCILYYNRAPMGANYDDVSAQFQYCCTVPLPPGTGNFTNEPQLASESHLSADSPCRGAGSTNYARGRDLDGEIWVKPPAAGCDEYIATSATGAVSIAISAPFASVAVGRALNLSLRCSGRLSASRWEFGDGTIVSNRPAVSHAWPAAGDYLVVARAYNNTFPAGVTDALTIHVIPAPIHYVSLQSTNPAPPFDSWATAATNIQDAVDAATVAGAVVVVGNGLYEAGGRVISYQTNRLVVDKPITVRSLNGAGYTTLRGSGNPNREGYQIRGVCLKSDAALDGFSVIDGVAGQSGGGIWCESQDCSVTGCVLSNNYCGDSGGGIFSGTASNCTLLVNSAFSGGGAAWGNLVNCFASSNRAVTGAAAFQSDLGGCQLIANSANNYGGGASQSTLRQCNVVDNSAYYGGGGVYSSALFACLLGNNYCDSFGGGANGSTLDSSILVFNTAGSRGGGCDGSTLNNCTLVGNTAFPWGGGGAAFSTLSNCIAYYNFGTNGANSLSNTLNFCCTTPAPASGIGNFTNEPGFTDLANGNLRLQSNSPCINAGAGVFPISAADFDGRPRVVGGVVDVGACEYQGPGMSEFIDWLRQFGLPTDGSADYADTDNDLLNNWQEWRAGTSPIDPSSVLKILAVSRQNSSVAVTWQSAGAINYYLQASTNLGASPAFRTVASNIIGQTGTTIYTDTNAIGSGQRFYRVGVQ